MKNPKLTKQEQRILVAVWAANSDLDKGRVTQIVVLTLLLARPKKHKKAP